MTNHPRTARLSRAERNDLMERLCARYANSARAIYEMDMRCGHSIAPHAAMEPSDWLRDAAWEQLSRMLAPERLDRFEGTRASYSVIREIMDDACAHHKQTCEFVGWDERYPQIDGYAFGDSDNAKSLR